MTVGATAVASATQVFLWAILPYFAFAVFAVGHFWRYRTDQFSWTSRSTQVFERKILGWAGPAFHYGALAVIGGHVVGLAIPASVTEAIGVPEFYYRWFSAVAGTLAAVVCVSGLIGLIYRRTTNPRVRGATSRIDMVTYVFLATMIGLGVSMTVGYNLLGHGYNYRDSVSPWWRSLFYLDPNVAAISSAPAVYKAHVIVSYGFFMLFPFSRLVHAWSIPLQFLGRPWILYRGRAAVRR